VNLAFSLVVGVLFGTGVFLLLKADLFRVVAGIVLISNAANLTLMASGVTRGASPILPAEEGGQIADPLVQAMTLTALVIGFATFPISLFSLAALFESDFAWPAASALAFPLLAWMLIFPVLFIWFLYRMIRGLVRAADDRPY